MRRHIRLVILWVCFGVGFLVGIPSLAVGDDLVVIANKAFPVDAISSLDVMEIYTGHFVVYQRFKVQPFDQPDNQKAKRAFLTTVLRFTPESYRDHWIKWTFKTGRQPPAILQDSKAVIQAVQKEAGGLGYVWDSEVQGVEDIKVLLKIPGGS